MQTFLLIKAVQRMSEGLYILPLSFCQTDSNPRQGEASPLEKYFNSWVLSLARKIHLDMSPIPSLIFVGLKVRILASSRL